MLPGCTLRLRDKWVWDFWFAQDGANYHMFYLQASRDLIDPELRHWNVSIGHAVSQDLRHWKLLPDAIAPGVVGNRKELTTWTGSIIRHQDLWYLFYTTSYIEQDGKIQHISLATSKDLIHWEKYGDNPLFGADSKYYEKFEQNDWHDEAWRDPWVFQDPQTGEFHAYITGRLKQGFPATRGVIAHAISKDLTDWQVLEPITQPTRFGTMECPQLVEIKERYYLLFSVQPGEYVGSKLTGIFYMVADNPYGPFSPPVALCADLVGQLYSGKLLLGPDNQWYLTTWRNRTLQNEFIGDICEPIPIDVDDLGNLIMVPAAIAA